MEQLRRPSTVMWNVTQIPAILHRETLNFWKTNLMSLRRAHLHLIFSQKPPPNSTLRNKRIWKSRLPWLWWCWICFSIFICGNTETVWAILSFSCHWFNTFMGDALIELMLLAQWQLHCSLVICLCDFSMVSSISVISLFLHPPVMRSR